MTLLENWNHADDLMEITAAKREPRVRASTTRRKYASKYAQIMEYAPAWTEQYVPYVLGELTRFEQENKHLPLDVSSMIEILRAQTRTLLGLSTDTQSYQNALSHMNTIGGPTNWYHAYVAKPIREGKMRRDGKRIIATK